MKQNKIIGVFYNNNINNFKNINTFKNLNYLNYNNYCDIPSYIYNKNWDNIAYDNTINLKKYYNTNNINSNLDSSILHIKNKYSFSIELAFKINNIIDKKTEFSENFNKTCIKSCFPVVNIRNESLFNATNSDNVGWFYGYEFDNSLYLGKDIELNNKSYSYSILEDYSFNIKSSMNNNDNKQIQNIIINSEDNYVSFNIISIIKYISKYITLYPNDIVISYKIFDNISIIHDYNKIYLDIELKKNNTKEIIHNNLYLNIIQI